MNKPVTSRPPCLAVLAFLLMIIPGAAEAHAILVESQPAIGGTAPSGRVVFKLRYNSRIDHARSRLTLSLPDKTQEVLPTASNDAVDTLSAVADLAPGAYALRWQVLAVDGHITRGAVPFNVGPLPSASPAASGPVPPAAP